MKSCVIGTRIAALALLGLTGCDGNPVAEAFEEVTINPAETAGTIIRSNLQAPDSYQFVSGKTLWTGTDKEGNEAYVVVVGYNAQNGFGALLRGCSYVAYSIDQDDLLTWNPTFGLMEGNRADCEGTSPLVEESRSQTAKFLVETNFGGSDKSHGSTQKNDPDQSAQLDDIMSNVEDAAASAEAAAAEAEALANQLEAEY